ncbi:MAG: Na+/H+ antiporter subunit E [Cytophagaceae bacterium]
MRLFLSNISLVIVWLFITGQFSLRNFLLGYAVSYLVLWLSYRKTSPQYFMKVFSLITFILFFLKELIKANLKVMYDIVTPKHYMRPGILSVPLDTQDELQITVLANLLTLTPGTLAVEVSYDKKMMYVHCMYIQNKDEVKNGIKKFEKKVLDLLSYD